MRTIDLSTLQERSNRELSKLKAPEAFKKAALQRVALLNAASGTRQIEEYGAKRFRAEFVRMQDIPVRQLLGKDDTEVTPEQLLNKIWRALPNSPFKRFQEAFSEPRNYVVPLFCITREGRITFGKDVAQICRSVAPCIIAPHRIPDALVEELGIAVFSADQRRDPAARFLRKSERDVREGLKARWDSCSPLGKQDFRVMVLERPMGDEAKALASRYPYAKPTPERGVHGSVIVTRAANESAPPAASDRRYLIQPQRSRPLVFSLFTSGFSAYRKTLNQREGYDGEVSEITEISSELGRVGQRISNEWRKGVSDEVKNEILVELKSAASDALTVLERDVDVKKRTAKHRFAHSQFGRDSLNRLNPRSTVANLFLGIEQLSKRLKEVAHKGGYNETDRVLLATALKNQTATIEGCLKTYGKLASGAPSQSQSALASELALLKTNDLQLREVKIKPLSTFAGVLRVYGERHAATIKARSSNDLGYSALQIFCVLTKAAIVTERLKTLLATETDGVNVPKLQKQLGELKDAAEKAERLGKAIDAEAVEALTTLASSVDKQVGKFAEVMTSETKTIAWSERLRETLRSVDFEQQAFALHDRYDAQFTKTAKKK